MYVIKRLDTGQYYTQSYRAEGYWSYDIDLSKVYLTSPPATTQMERFGRHHDFPMTVIEVTLEEV